MAFQLLVANQLGASGYGLVALALASAAMLFPLADLGISNLALRQLSSQPQNHGLTRRLIELKLIAIPVFIVPVFIWAAFACPDRDLRWPLVCAAGFYGFQSLSDLFRQILRVRQQAFLELAVRLAYPIGALVAFLTLWPAMPTPLGAMFTLLCGPLALAVAGWLALPKSDRAVSPGADCLRFARQNSTILVQSTIFLLFAGLATRADVFVLNRFGGVSEVGRYFAAFNLMAAGTFFGQGLASYLYPRLHRQKERRVRAMLRSTWLQIMLGSALWLGVALVGPLVFRLVFREGSFQGAESMLPELGAILFLATLDSLWLSVMIGRDKMWIAILNLAPILGCKLFLGALWVPRHGALGMVWASLAGQLVSGMIAAAVAWTLYLKSSANHDNETGSQPA